jgi:ELWxxDGT repeat protein
LANARRIFRACTHIVKDILPGGFGSNPSDLTNVSGTLFFWANDGSHGTELWRSNGTAAGTQMVSSSLDGPSYLTNVGGTLFFPVSDGTHGTELWRSNGTLAGTQIVKDINPGSGGSNPGNLANLGGTLFFSADDGTHGVELWRSNGTAGGTVLVKDINPGSHLVGPPGHQHLVPNSSYPSYFTDLGGTLLFSANDGTHGVELWRSNGTAAGTQIVHPGGGSNLTNLGGTLFFSANDGTHGVELWRSNGTAAGTHIVKDINPGGSGSYTGDLTNVGGTLFFSANDGTHGSELWRSNGTAAGTVLIKDIDPGSSGSSPGYLTNVNGTIFFSANDGVHGQELWQSNGTAAGTQLAGDIFPGSGSSNPGNLTNAGGTLFFSADDGVHGVEPWVLGPVPAAAAALPAPALTPSHGVPGAALTVGSSAGGDPGPWIGPATPPSVTRAPVDPGNVPGTEPDVPGEDIVWSAPTTASFGHDVVAEPDEFFALVDAGDGAIPYSRRGRGRG